MMRVVSSPSPSQCPEELTTYFITRNENEIDLHASMTITIDEEGYLINEADNARIAGIDENGRFIDLDLSTLSHYPATLQS